MNLNEFFENMIQLEENAKVLYEKFSTKCDERIKEIVINLAKEEENHKEIITKVFTNVKDIELELNEEIKTIVNDQLEYIKNKGDDLTFEKEKEFFNFAFEIEKRSIDAFSKIIKIFSKDSIEYNLFNTLIEEEKMHMIYILKKIHELK